MRRPGILLAAASIAFLCPLAHAFTITSSFANNANQTWTANQEAVVNQAINDWTTALSYSDPNQNINVAFPFVTVNPPSFLGLWQASGTSIPTGSNLFPYTTGISHNVFINTSYMTPRGVTYPDNVVLVFNSAAPTTTQWDGLTLARIELGQVLGFTTYYADSSGTSTANKWQDHVTVNGSAAVFDQTPGGLNIPLYSSTIFTAFADPNDLMYGGTLNPAVRKTIGFQDLEALSLAYGYTITITTGTTYSTPTFKTQTITLNGTVAVASSTAARGTPAVALSTQNISFGAAGLLDISNHDLIIHGGQTLPQVQALVAAGKGNGSFNGTSGITSSTAITDGTTLAVGTAAAANISTFDGLSVSPSDILVKYTFPGDANMDGQVTPADLTTVLNNFGKPTPNWTDGNFDGAPTIDLTDLADVLNNMGRSIPQVAFAPAIPSASPASPTPEPASLALLLLAAPTLIRRRQLSTKH